MKELWDVYVALFTWQTGISIAFFAAIATAFIFYASSKYTYERLKDSIGWGSAVLVLAYAFVWLLIASKLNVYARWWFDEELTEQLALTPAVIIGIIVGIVVWRKESDGATSFFAGFVASFIVSLLLTGIFAIGDFFFLGIHYILYTIALIGLPTLFIAAVYFIISKLNYPGMLVIVFCYLTFCAFVAVIYLLSLTTDHSQGLNPSPPEIVEKVRSFSQYMISSLGPLLFLIGLFVIVVIIFYFRKTFGTWVVGISGLFIITSIQLIMVKTPLLDNIRNLFRTSNLTWIFVIYVVTTASLGTYYLWTLYRKRVEKKAENLHPLLAIGAVVFNICFLYPVIISSEPWLWGAWFAGINLLIGLIILLGRLQVLIRIQKDKESLEKIKS
jgi:hypothetical protein